MKIGLNFSWVVLFLFAAVTAAQGTFGDGFGVNLTKLCDDIIGAVRDEVQALRPDAAIQNLRDQIRSLDDKIRGVTKTHVAFQTDIRALRKENHELIVALQKLVFFVQNAQALAPINIDTRPLPPFLRVNNTNFTYSLISPQGALAHLLASSQRPKEGEGQEDEVEEDNGSDMTNFSDWKEEALFWTMLMAIILYILVLVCMYCKKTAESQLRGQPKKSSRNAAFESWKMHRKLEKDHKARDDEKLQLKIMEQLKNKEESDSDQVEP